MNRKLNIGLSIAAGLLGGLLSHYISPALVRAQTQAAPPKESRAQSFVLVDADGKAAGLFGFDQDGQANVILLDKTGKVLWSASGKPNAKPLAVSLAK
jgi:predicted transcriptional regulator